MTYDNFVVEYSYLKRIEEVLNDSIWLVSFQFRYEYKTVQMLYFIIYLFISFTVTKNYKFEISGENQHNLILQIHRRNLLIYLD